VKRNSCVLRVTFLGWSCDHHIGRGTPEIIAEHAAILLRVCYAAWDDFFAMDMRHACRERGKDHGLLCIEFTDEWFL